MQSEINKLNQSDFFSLFSNDKEFVTAQHNFKEDRAQVIKLNQPIGEKPVQSDFLTDLINPKFSFDYLFVGDFNSIPYKASQELINSQNPIYNPLFITSEKRGLGKTHFAQAIALAFRDKKIPGQNRLPVIHYTSADSFTQEFVTSIKTNTIETFKYKFRKQIDVLVLDDVDKLSGRYKTQTELIFAFEQLINANKKVIFTSSSPVNKLKGFDPKLISRLQSGLLVSICEPRISEIESIITKKSNSFNLMLTREMTRFIALNSNTNINLIEGILVKILAECSLNRKKLSMELLADILATNHVREETKISLKSIELVVCKNFGITPDKIISRSRKQQIAEIRMMIMALARKYTSMPHSDIGSYYGKNHNTVIHACDTIEAKKNSSPIFKLQLEHIESQLNNIIHKAQDVVI